MMYNKNNARKAFGQRLENSVDSFLSLVSDSVILDDCMLDFMDK